MADLDSRRCEWTALPEALAAFADPAAIHQSARHIRPLHWYVASRLCIEGGFRPDEITPRPPFTISSEKHSTGVIVYDPDVAGHGERTVLGGLKTKNVDVVVDKPGIGPVVCVSLKGTLRAFRNLTNRMEEAAGDCANLHITYPALVYGFLSLIRGNVAGDDVPANDVAMADTVKPHENIRRYHEVLERLAHRTGIRDEASRYEAMGLGLVVPETGELSEHFPHLDDALRFERFFVTLYQRYDERYVFAAPALASMTRRMTWRETPELQQHQPEYDYPFRFA